MKTGGIVPARMAARRIYGIFGFRRAFLKTYTSLSLSPLEVKKACDSNKICDHGYRQVIAPYPFRLSFSVDSPEDLKKVEAQMQEDPLWGTY